MRLGPHDLLEYNARYRVLICRDCHYAIQKNALNSHLLRHKIYREERQRLLSTINNLDIVDPDDLILLTADTVRIDALPVMSGHCCSVTGCRHLCASSKRMRRHWSDAHGVHESNDFSSLARPVKLQTFFRGTKLRYFEVSVTESSAESQLSKTESGYGRESPRLNAAPSPAQSTLPNSESYPAVDLETLTYFHHFITATKLSLPGGDGSLSASQYWEKEIIPLALQRRWMMCGILAISAYHLATLDDEITARRNHCERARKLHSEFFAGFNMMINDDKNIRATEAFQKESKAGKQIGSILNCTRWTLNGFSMSQETTQGTANLSQLQSILRDIRSTVSPESATSSCIEQSRFGDSQRALDKNGSLESEYSRTMLLNHIDMLPYRMAEIFGKPDHEQDAPAVLLAIGTLHKCYISSLESDGLSGAWQCMAAWLIKTPDYFNRMVSHQNSAALVVLAYWAAILVRQAETRGNWFVHGLSRTVLLQIRAHLSTDDAAQALVQEVKEWAGSPLRS
ncbi:uncharacterized protein N7503_010128 [Penicillium pulvis]|uniref:uncharacterized protein n=1 Tax=Penicillium pulvis TaxID=1562058 RepID=UPI0025481998|nr:uncharacterized protein N7503_010128 [Penicillium pulvis]KAJ5784916.1 hypothetical protein N7503_010128 [Penicillium pulvis]